MKAGWATSQCDSKSGAESLHDADKTRCRQSAFWQVGHGFAEESVSDLKPVFASCLLQTTLGVAAGRKTGGQGFKSSDGRV